MKLSIKKTLAVTALALVSSVFAANSQAALVNLKGSSTIGAFGATISGANLNDPGLITIDRPFYGTNIDDYSPISSGGLFTLAGSLNLADVSTFRITGPEERGTYLPSELVIETQNASFLNVYTRGIFTPGSVEGTQSGGCQTGGNTCAATDTSLRWSFTQSGDSISASATLSSPAILLTAIPEPASLSLLGIGLMGCMASRRKLVKQAVA